MSVKITRRPATGAPTPASPVPTTKSDAPLPLGDAWSATVLALRETEPTVAGILAAATVRMSDGEVEVILAPHFAPDVLVHRRGKIEALMLQFAGRPMRLKVVISAKRAAPGDSSLAASLARAREVSTRLGAATDKLNASLMQIESELAAMNLGVTATVEMERDDADANAPMYFRKLRFGKENREWKLMYDAGYDGYADWTVTPLLNTSREIRLLAVDHLPALIEELVKTAEAEIAGVAKKAEEVEKLATLVRNGGAK